MKRFLIEACEQSGSISKSDLHAALIAAHSVCNAFQGAEQWFPALPSEGRVTIAFVAQAIKRVPNYHRIPAEVFQTEVRVSLSWVNNCLMEKFLTVYHYRPVDLSVCDGSQFLSTKPNSQVETGIFDRLLQPFKTAA